MVEQNQSTYYKNGYKFNAKELDAATGMYYYGARYYDPSTSIFLSVDPLAEQTMEPYSYVGNNPINFTDPTGMSKESGPGKNKQSTAAMVYNHTGLKKSVDWVSSLFTPAERQKVLRFTKDVETTMVMKNGGWENDRTAGTSRGETNMDNVTDASPSFKSSTKGKGIVEIVGDLIGGYQAGEVAAKKVEEQHNIIVSRGKEIKQEVGFENGKVISVSEESRDVIFKGTQSKVEKQLDSLNEANQIRRESTKVLTR